MKFGDYIRNNMPFSFSEDNIYVAIQTLKRYIVSQNPIYIIGNGGSAFTASHFCQDLTKLFGANVKSLSDNVGLITAIGNDVSFDKIYTYQLERLAPGLLIAISFSGKSPNIVNAMKYYVNDRHLETLLFTGKDGGDLVNIAPIQINISSNDIYFVEGMHSLLLHFIIDQLFKTR
jgi:D-sedoheptulose 7-phosphate isomerase